MIKKYDQSKIRMIPTMNPDGSKGSFGQGAITYEHKQIISLVKDNTTVSIATNHVSVSGHVVDAEGHPVNGKVIMFKPNDVGLDFDNLPRQYSVSYYYYAPTESDGAFDMGSIPPGHYEIGLSSAITMQGFDLNPLTKIVVDEGVPINNLEIIISEEKNEE